MVTMREVASRAGVSVKTVSRVFNQDPHVLPETRRRVEDVLVTLNYTPNSLARTFRDGRSPVIGVAVPDIADPFFSAIADGVEQVASRHDMSVLVTNLGADPGREEERLGSLLKRQLGALVMAPTSTDQGHLARWAVKLPVVFVDRPPRGVDADCYVEDDFGGALAATAHLVEHGHTRIAFAGNTTEVSTTANRLRGYRAAMEQAGIAVDEDLVQLGAASASGAVEAVRRMTSAAPPPTAVFSSDAQTTMVLVPALTGRRLAITAFGDFPMAAMLSPALTVIDQDPSALGRLAAERVVHRLGEGGEEPVTRVTLPVRLLERASCRPVDELVELFPWSVPGGGGRLVWTSPTG